MAYHYVALIEGDVCLVRDTQWKKMEVKLYKNTNTFTVTKV